MSKFTRQRDQEETRRKFSAIQQELTTNPLQDARFEALTVGGYTVCLKVSVASYRNGKPLFLIDDITETSFAYGQPIVASLDYFAAGQRSNEVERITSPIAYHSINDARWSRWLEAKRAECQ